MSQINGSEDINWFWVKQSLKCMGFESFSIYFGKSYKKKKDFFKSRSTQCLYEVIEKIYHPKRFEYKTTSEGYLVAEIFSKQFQ